MERGWCAASRSQSRQRPAQGARPTALYAAVNNRRAPLPPTSAPQPPPPQTRAPDGRRHARRARQAQPVMSSGGGGLAPPTQLGAPLPTPFGRPLPPPQPPTSVPWRPLPPPADPRYSATPPRWAATGREPLRVNRVPPQGLTKKNPASRRGSSVDTPAHVRALAGRPRAPAARVLPPGCTTRAHPPGFAPPLSVRGRRGRTTSTVRDRNAGPEIGRAHV